MSFGQMNVKTRWGAQNWASKRCLAALLTIFMVSFIALPALASGLRFQDIDDEALADRPIASVRIEGLERTNDQLVRNNLRTASGQPFDATAIKEDVETLYRLGQFDTVLAEAELNDNGTVDIIYIVESLTSL